MYATSPTVGFTGLHQQGYDSLTMPAFFKTFVTHPSQRTDTLLFLPTHTFTLAPEHTRYDTIQEPLHFYAPILCSVSCMFCPSGPLDAAAVRLSHGCITSLLWFQCQLKMFQRQSTFPRLFGVVLLTHCFSKNTYLQLIHIDIQLWISISWIVEGKT